MTAIAADNRNSRPNLVYTALRVIVGFLVTSGVLALIRHFRASMQTLPPTDMAAVGIGYVFLTLGLFASILSFHPRWAGRRLEQDPSAPPASRKEIGFIRLEAGSLVLAGVLFLTPPLFAASGVTVQQARLTFAGIVILFLLQTAINVLVWRRADEFLRQTLSKISMVSFWLLQGILFVAAAAERLGIVHGISLWNACIAMLVLYLIASSILAIQSARA